MLINFYLQYFTNNKLYVIHYYFCIAEGAADDDFDENKVDDEDEEDDTALLRLEKMHVKRGQPIKEDKELAKKAEERNEKVMRTFMIPRKYKKIYHKKRRIERLEIEKVEKMEQKRKIAEENILKKQVHGKKQQINKEKKMAQQQGKKNKNKNKNK